MNVLVKKIGIELKQELFQIYGKDLEDIILYGSHARGDFNSNSDVDFAVIIKNNNLKTSQEIIKISERSNSIGFKYKEIISIFPISSLRFYESNFGIIKAIKEEGVSI